MSLEQIGQKLKGAREGQGLSLRQIHERTKIPVGHLMSIESGFGEELPEPVYVAGFIKRYAECVGLNGQNLSEEYRRQSEEKPENGKNGWGAKPAPQPVYISPDLGRAKLDRERPTFKTIYFNAIWIVVIVGLISYLNYTQMTNQANQQDPSVLALREATSRYAAPAASTQANTTAPAGNDARLSLSANQHVWVEVRSVANGASLFTGYLEQGDRRDFQDQQGLRVRAGNGGSLTVDFQGRIEPFGPAGNVAERTFMAPTVTQAEPAADTRPSLATSAPKPASVKRASRRSDESAGQEGRRSRFRNLDDAPSRQYLPGESLGTRSIDVPYRYSDGRLDAD